MRLRIKTENEKTKPRKELNKKFPNLEKQNSQNAQRLKLNQWLLHALKTKLKKVEDFNRNT